MHELSITKNIFQIVLKHAKKSNVKKVIAVNLEIGVLSDLQNEWVQRYFDYLSQRTIVEGAKLRIIKVPAVFHCSDCMQSFKVDSLIKYDLSCTMCNSKNIALVSGREYHVKNMEVQ